MSEDDETGELIPDDGLSNSSQYWGIFGETFKTIQGMLNEADTISQRIDFDKLILNSDLTKLLGIYQRLMPILARVYNNKTKDSRDRQQKAKVKIDGKTSERRDKIANTNFTRKITAAQIKFQIPSLKKVDDKTLRSDVKALKKEGRIK